MDIHTNGYPNGHPSAIGADQRPPKSPTNGGVEPQAASAKEALDAAGPGEAQANQPAVAPGEEDDRSGLGRKGVLRNLEAGHFKGVADVRLRVNFFDQLSANAIAAAYAVVEAGASDLVHTISAEVDQLLDGAGVDDRTQASIDGLRAEFDAAVQAAVTDLASGGVLDRDALEQAIQSAFDTLVGGLREVFGPPADDVEASMHTESAGAEDDPPKATDTTSTDALPAETASPSGDPGGDPVAALDEPFASLIEAFGESLVALVSAVDTALRLPDPSPPSGNGAAYAKFLAMYDELRGIEPSGDAPTQDGPTDITV